MKIIWRFWIVVWVGLACAQPVRAQISTPFSGGEYHENDLLHVGIHFTYRLSYYVIAHRDGWELMSVTLPDGSSKGDFESITSYPSGNNIGVGIPVDLRLNGNLNLMFSPTFYPQFDGLNMGESIRFRYIGSDPDVKRHRQIGGGDDELNHASFDFPLHLKFRSDEKYLDRRASLGRYKLYMLAGGKYSTNINNNKYYRTSLDGLTPYQYPLISKSGFFSWEAGAGLDVFFTYFKMSLEARFAQSLGSVLDHDSPHAVSSLYMHPIERARLRSFQFSIFLE